MNKTHYALTSFENYGNQDRTDSKITKLAEKNVTPDVTPVIKTRLPKISESLVAVV